MPTLVAMGAIGLMITTLSISDNVESELGVKVRFGQNSAQQENGLR